MTRFSRLAHCVDRNPDSVRHSFGSGAFSYTPYCVTRRLALTSCVIRLVRIIQPLVMTLFCGCLHSCANSTIQHYVETGLEPRRRNSGSAIHNNNLTLKLRMTSLITVFTRSKRALRSLATLNFRYLAVPITQTRTIKIVVIIICPLVACTTYCNIQFRSLKNCCLSDLCLY